MRKQTLATLFLFTVLFSFGQTRQDYDNFINSSLKLSTKAIVYEQLNLSQTEVEAFDKIFDKYLEKRNTMASERLPVMLDYSINAGNMTSEEINDFNIYLLNTSVKLTKLNKKFFNKAKKVISPKKATQVILIEHYLRSQVESNLIENLFEFTNFTFSD